MRNAKFTPVDDDDDDDPAIDPIVFGIAGAALNIIAALLTFAAVMSPMFIAGIMVAFGMLLSVGAASLGFYYETRFHPVKRWKWSKMTKLGSRAMGGGIFGFFFGFVVLILIAVR